MHKRPKISLIGGGAISLINCWRNGVTHSASFMVRIKYLSNVILNSGFRVNFPYATCVAT